jgi:hypothetical protein
MAYAGPNSGGSHPYSQDIAENDLMDIIETFTYPRHHSKSIR